MMSEKEILLAELEDLKTKDRAKYSTLEKKRELKAIRAEIRRRKHRGLFALSDATVSVGKDIGKVSGFLGKVGLKLGKKIITPTEADIKRMKRGGSLTEGLPD